MRGVRVENNGGAEDNGCVISYTPPPLAYFLVLTAQYSDGYNIIHIVADVIVATS